MSGAGGARRGDLPALSAEQESWIERAIGCIDEVYLFDVLARMVETPSPTGAERPLAEQLVAEMEGRGISATLQPFDGTRGNAVGRIAGTGEGPRLLLYGQLDTTFTNDRQEDRPVLGDADRPDLKPRSDPARRLWFAASGSQIRRAATPARWPPSMP